MIAIHPKIGIRDCGGGQTRPSSEIECKVVERSAIWISVGKTITGDSGGVPCLSGSVSAPPDPPEASVEVTLVAIGKYVKGSTGASPWVAEGLKDIKLQGLTAIYPGGIQACVQIYGNFRGCISVCTRCTTGVDKKQGIAEAARGEGATRAEVQIKSGAIFRPL